MAQLTVPGSARKSVYGRTRRELHAKLRNASWLMTQGMPVNTRGRSTGAYLRDWLEVTKLRIRPSTFRSYEMNVRRLLPELGPVPVRRLTPAAIQATYQRMERAGLSPYSILQAHRMLHRALAQAMHWGFVPSNPAALVFPPRPTKRQTMALSLEELLSVFGSTEGDYLHALWVLLGTAGLRIGEALALAWSDIDLESGRVIVWRTLHRQANEGWRFLPPKTRTSRRLVVLTPFAIRALEWHRALAANRPSCCDLGVPRDLVFTGRKGRPLHQSVVMVQLRKALERAGVPRIRLHDMRHTAATSLLTAGVHPKLVQDMLGHSTIITTMDVYSHVMPAVHGDAVLRLDQMLNAARSERCMVAGVRAPA